MTAPVGAAASAVRSVTTSRRLTMGDVDAIQVYAPNYFRWMDQGIHELFAQLGHPIGELITAGFGTPAVTASCEYFSPVVLDDVLECTTRVARLGTTSFDLAHEFTCGGRAVARGEMTHVWVSIGDTQQATPVPGWLRASAEAPAPHGVPAADPSVDAGSGVAYSHCTRCERRAWPPEPSCVACGSDTTPGRSTADGTLTTWTVVRHAPAGFTAPYVLGWVELVEPALSVMGVVHEGVTRLDDLEAGLPVVVSAADDLGDPSRTPVHIEVAP